MNVDGTGARVLKPSGTAGIGLDDLSNADWSPDGKWLVVANFAGQQFLINATDATAIPLSTLTTGYQQMSFVR
jgi:Tol biopolymer transport system component